MSDKVNIKQSTMVKPAEQTPKRRLWLSRLDMIVRMPLSHAASLHVYSPTANIKESNNNNNNNGDNDNNNNNNILFFDANILMDSLSKALVPFYPMAGRLTQDKNGRVEIDCNGEGALFIEAETTQYSLADLGDFKPTMELRKLVIPSCDYSKGLSSFPLLMVQLTRFKCGGVTLGFAGHHHVADGLGHVHFINEWARLARGLDLELMPFHERAPHLAPRDPPQVKFQHLEFNPPASLLLANDSRLNLKLEKEVITASVFKFTKEQVDALKQKATSSEVLNQRLSTYKVLAGHIWRTACMARGLVDDQEVRLYIPTDGRYRLKNPALPEGFSGNVVFFPACIAKAGDVTRNPLWYAASKIHETLETMTDEEYLRSAVDYLETHPNFDALVRGPHSVRCPNLSINSWAKLDLHKADYGWGKPLFAGHGGIGWEGQSYLVRSPNRDGGFSLSVSLFTHHIALFEKYLYEF